MKLKRNEIEYILNEIGTKMKSVVEMRIQEKFCILYARQFTWKCSFSRQEIDI